MQLRIHARGVGLHREERLWIERKLRLSVARHAAVIDSVQATLFPPSKDLERMRCRIRLRLVRGGGMTVEDDADDPLAAASGAAWRLEQRLERQRMNRIAELAATAPRRFGVV